MSDEHAEVAEAEADAQAEPRSIDAAMAAMQERFAATPDPRAKWDDGLIIGADRLVAAATCLRDEFGFSILLDIAGIDYLDFAGHRDERFAVAYLFKNVATCDRLRLKVMVEEGDEEVPTLVAVYRSADWAEREVWDQYGIRFDGHPNLKRILNHHQFEGHPLRKDYPVQKRQHCSINDPMVDQLEARLRAKGFDILEHTGGEGAQ